VKPPVDVSTKEAYSVIKPVKPSFDIEKLPSLPVSEWKNVLRNDFEPVIFEKYPVIKEIKDILYEKGAEFASMSGSGSAVYGLFKKTASLYFPKCFVWKGMLD
jgi:4-diphosphocytidyl-2-C-methyl-D-erythritol kinase